MVPAKSPGSTSTPSPRGQYDETFRDWGYIGPQTAAAIMA